MAIRGKELSPFATHEEDTKGRKVFEEETSRSCFHIDSMRIIYSKSFRRLAHKTQVFIFPEGAHYRNRLTHTLEVACIGKQIARGLGLNEDLVECGCKGHDLGTGPFAHSGEKGLNIMSNGYFHHNLQSVRVVDKIENNHQGLNLTWEVVDAICNHRTAGTPHTLEGRVVQLSDKIAYLNHDIDDVLRSGILKEKDLPKDVIKVLGDTNDKRIETLVNSLIRNSYWKKYVAFEEEVEVAFKKLRAFMFQRIYESGVIKTEDKKAQEMIMSLYEAYMKNLKLLPQTYLKQLEVEKPEVVLCDYISGMTDQFALDRYTELHIPKKWLISK